MCSSDLLSLKDDSGNWKIDYAANGFGTWDATYTGFGNSTSRPMMRAEGTPRGAPSTLTLDAAPNPFGGGTVISYVLTRPGRVGVAIYSVTGQKVATLFEGERPSGFGIVEWRGMDGDGKPVAPGLYFCRLEAEGRSLTRKLTMMR